MTRIQRLAGYVVGTLAMFWAIDRVAGFLVKPLSQKHRDFFAIKYQAYAFQVLSNQ